ncbi:hypothetical protein HY837_06605 [archaeon]|nr:hypothetical protein [archaeon]
MKQTKQTVTDFDFAYEAGSGQNFVGVYVTGVIVTSEAVPVGPNGLDRIMQDLVMHEVMHGGPAVRGMSGDFEFGNMHPDFVDMQPSFLEDKSSSMPRPMSDADKARALKAQIDFDNYLKEQVSAKENKSQSATLYGNPGTGKTFVAPLTKPSDKKIVLEITDGSSDVTAPKVKPTEPPAVL